MLRIGVNEILMKLSLTLPLALGKAQTRMLNNELNGDMKSCLDIGCGRGRFEYLKHFYSIGCDIHQPTLLEGRKRGYYNDLVKCDACHLPFKQKSFDTVLSTELLEHLDKTDGEGFLKQAEDIACKKMVITTPWGFSSQESITDNPYQIHATGWLPQELQERGYNTQPFYSFRFPKGNRPINIMAKYGFTVLLYPLIRLFPERFAMDFVAIKEIGPLMPVVGQASENNEKGGKFHA